MDEHQVEEILYFVARRERISAAEARRWLNQGYRYVVSLVPQECGWRDPFGSGPSSRGYDD
jgi:hypothetical protein